LVCGAVVAENCRERHCDEDNKGREETDEEEEVDVRYGRRALDTRPLCILGAISTGMKERGYN